MNSTATNSPTFKRLPGGVQEVRVNGTLAGTVRPTQGGYWTSTYNDGSNGPMGNTRTEAAWALINS